MKTLQDKLESISIQLEELKKESNKKNNDTITKDAIQKKSEMKKAIEIISKKTKLVIPKEKPLKPTIPSNDTIYHRFLDGRLSVKIAPRSDRQKIWIYLPTGEVIYELENIHLSYSSYNELFFRKNGALEKIINHFNPGASLYMYKTYIFFDEGNEPKYKIDEKMPSTLEEQTNNKSLWDRENRRWIKQEIVKETNTPVKN